MSENLQQEKENTIDILVSPKKKEEARESAPKHTTPPAPPKKEEGKVPSRVRTSAGMNDRTRAIPGSGEKKPAVKDRAQETRVGSSLPPRRTTTPQKGTSGEKKTEKPKVTKEKKVTTPAEWKAIRNSLCNTAIIAAIYIAAVVAVSALLAYLGINWANDIFALVKDETVAVVTIPENATLSEVANILADEGLIEYPAIFRMYVGFKNRDSDPPLSFKAGEYELKSTLNYDQIVSLIKSRRSREIVTVTIPEGYTIDEIIDLFTSQGIGTREGFEEAIQEYPYDYAFMKVLNEIELSPDRKYRLEGYLFPDTYEFYTDSGEIAIVDKMLANFDLRFEKEYYERLEELDMNLDELVTLASIVQSEGKLTKDFYKISGVFHNRLNSKRAEFAYLQSDATIQYCLEERVADLTFEELAINDPYNTYLYRGLTPSAIANPGWEAIQAALYPESHNYYYFLSDTDGSTLFAATLEEHNRHKALLATAKENGTTID